MQGRIDFRHILCALLLALTSTVQALPVCVTPPDGIGGTGHADGIGGTGIEGVGGTGSQARSNDGIGGTGQQAKDSEGLGGTGIQGVITGFASVCVNGFEVHTGGQTSVALLGQPAMLGDLRVGQIVVIHATGPADNLQARHIEVAHAAVGPVDRTPGGNELSVMGQRIKLLGDTRYAPGLDPMSLPRGAGLRVSGLRAADGTLHATRLDPALLAEPARLSGMLQGTLGSPRIDATAVRLPPGENAAFNREVSVIGHWDGQRLTVARIEPETSLDLQRVERFSIQGLAWNAPGKEAINVCGQRFELTPRTRFTGGRAGIDDPVVINGRVDKQGRLIAEEVVRQRRIMDNRLAPQEPKGKNSKGKDNPGVMPEDDENKRDSGRNRSGSSDSRDEARDEDRSNSGSGSDSVRDDSSRSGSGERSSNSGSSERTDSTSSGSRERDSSGSGSDRSGSGSGRDDRLRDDREGSGRGRGRGGRD